MPTIPVVCKECGFAFSSGIQITSRLTASGNLSFCPNCNKTTPIPDVIQGVIQYSDTTSLNNFLNQHEKFKDNSKKLKISDGIITNSNKSKIQNGKKQMREHNNAIQYFYDSIGINLHITHAFIHQLRGGFDHTTEYTTLEKLINYLLRNYKAFYQVGRGLNCHRGIRVSRDRLINGIKPDGEFTKIGRFSYKPIDLTKEYGRCHKPGMPVFYASSTSETIFSELDVELNDFVLIGTWKAKNNNQIRSIYIGALDYYRKTQLIPFPVWTAEHYEMVKKDISNEVKKRLGDKKQFGLISMLIDAFFSDVFSKPAYTFKEYKITSIVSNYLFENRKFDVIGYPSVKHFGSTNYALRPNFIDRNLELKKIILYKIVSLLGFGLYGTEKIEEITIEKDDSTIVWPIHQILSKI